MVRWRRRNKWNLITVSDNTQDKIWCSDGMPKRNRFRQLPFNRNLWDNRVIAATSTWRFNLMVLRILDETLTVKIFQITQRVYNGNVTLTLFVKGLILQSSTIKITSGGPWTSNLTAFGLPMPKSATSETISRSWWAINQGAIKQV